MNNEDKQAWNKASRMAQAAIRHLLPPPQGFVYHPALMLDMNGNGRIA